MVATCGVLFFFCGWSCCRDINNSQLTCSNSISVGITNCQCVCVSVCVRKILASSSNMTPAGRLSMLRPFGCCHVGEQTANRTLGLPYSSAGLAPDEASAAFGIAERMICLREEWPSSALSPEGFHYTRPSPRDLLLGKRRSNGVKSDSLTQEPSPEGRSPMKRATM